MLSSYTSSFPTSDRLTNPSSLISRITVSIVGLFFVLIYISIVNYLPSYLHFLRNRIAYYVFGDESVPLFNDVWGWISKAGTAAGAGTEGLGRNVSTAAGVVLGTGTTKAAEVVVTGRTEL
jgi:hypothetical protein